MEVGRPGEGFAICQAGGAKNRGVGQQLGGGAVGDDPALVDQDHARLHRRRTKGRSCVASSRASLRPVEDFHQPAAGAAVEVGGRLVQQQQIDLHGQHGRQRGGPLLTGRHVVGRSVFEPGQPDLAMASSARRWARRDRSPGSAVRRPRRPAAWA